MKKKNYGIKEEENEREKRKDLFYRGCYLSY